METDYGGAHMELSIVPSDCRATFAKVETIAKRVKARRDELGLTQGQLAALAGVDQSIISDIENGKGMKAETLMGVAAGLETTPEWVMAGGTPDAKVEAEAASLLRSMEPEARQAAIGSLRGIVAAKPRKPGYTKQIQTEPPQKGLKTPPKKRAPKKNTVE